MGKRITPVKSKWPTTGQSSPIRRPLCSANVSLSRTDTKCPLFQRYPLFTGFVFSGVCSKIHYHSPYQLPLRTCHHAVYLSFHCFSRDRLWIIYCIHDDNGDISRQLIACWDVLKFPDCSELVAEVTDSAADHAHVIKHSAVQCSAVQCSAVQCSAVQCSAVQCSAVQCSAAQWVFRAIGHNAPCGLWHHGHRINTGYMIYP